MRAGYTSPAALIAVMGLGLGLGGLVARGAGGEGAIDEPARPRRVEVRDDSTMTADPPPTETRQQRRARERKAGKRATP